jgi:hypothetical protein
MRNKASMRALRRYSAALMSLALADFEDADRAILERLHKELSEVLRLLLPEDGHVDGAALRRRSEAPGWRSLMQSMKTFGLATYEVRPLAEVQKVMHDLRGGALAVLILCLQTARDTLSAAEVERLRRLARDHLNLLHACVRDVGAAHDASAQG